jgi:adenylylsulfate kinase
MSEHGAYHTWGIWPGWSTISASSDLSFTLWLTGLPGTGKTTLAQLVKKALVARGYKVEIIDSRTLSHWLNLKLQIDEEIGEDYSYTPGYDPIITYICALLARNGIISITSSVSPYIEARKYAREQISRLIEVYIHCSADQRQKRLQQRESAPSITPELYQLPTMAEINIDTTGELPERSALRVVVYLEQHGYVAPLWEDANTEDEEIAVIKARLQAMGYLE